MKPMVVHCGVIETDGEMNNVVHKESLCGLTGENLCIEEGFTHTLVSCKRCIKSINKFRNNSK